MSWWSQPDEHAMIVAISIGRLVFAMQRQIRGWRFVGMGVFVDDVVHVVKGDLELRRARAKYETKKRARKKRRHLALTSTSAAGP
jgi:hypothetical protein